ncbi:MAG TPA: Nif3-like dinuclear metal center hexameric protein [Candidatus Altiarchaeales archaeon]|nr:Nif3-like dinuclear metal center hexameric protein [Candidatus Altiarchaeales archaeon]
MAVSTNSVVRFLNNTLSIRTIPDSSRNGLQIRGSETVNKVGVAVDGCRDVFTLARKSRCDFVIVHHGLFWKGARDATGIRKQNVNYLKDHGISLYAVHLPLDLHANLGNNILLAQLLGLGGVKKFGRYHGRPIGYMGTLNKKTMLDELARKLEQKLNTKCTLLPFRKKKISTLGLVSGGGSASLSEAHLKRLDCLVTGEAPHEIHHLAKQLKINVVLAGHYETETLGVKALGKLLTEKYGLPYKFLHAPTII